MDGATRTSGPVTFTLRWLAVAAVVLATVGLVAGLVRGDVAGTLGPVKRVGMLGFRDRDLLRAGASREVSRSLISA